MPEGGDCWPLNLRFLWTGVVGAGRPPWLRRARYCSYMSVKFFFFCCGISWHTWWTNKLRYTCLCRLGLRWRSSRFHATMMAFLWWILQILWRLSSNVFWLSAHGSSGVFRHRCAYRNASKTSVQVSFDNVGRPFFFRSLFPLFPSCLLARPLWSPSAHRPIAWMMWNWQIQIIAFEKTRIYDVHHNRSVMDKYHSHLFVLRFSPPCSCQLSSSQGASHFQLWFWPLS